MRAGTRLFGSTFTDTNLQFQKSQKANFYVCVQLLVCFIYPMQQNNNLALWEVYELPKLLLFYVKI